MYNIKNNFRFINLKYNYCVWLVLLFLLYYFAKNNLYQCK